eukprot:15720317-Heterocapsa_arctica.AAC.1
MATNNSRQVWHLARLIARSRIGARGRHLRTFPRSEGGQSARQVWSGSRATLDLVVQTQAELVNNYKHSTTSSTRTGSDFAQNYAPAHLAR